MDSTGWEKVKDVIADALKLPVSERDAFVRERCPDPVLRAEVGALLKEYDEVENFLEHPPHVEEEPDELDDLQPGTKVGPYVIVDRLGRGGMGQVFLGSDPRLRRRVALKCLLSSRSAHDDRRARILQEARAAARISHPNVATVHDVLEHDGRAFIVMEYVEGESLSARLKRERLTIDRVVAIGRQLAAALVAAHAKGVVHRDLKPANVHLTPDGSVKVLDFGVARAEVATDASTDRKPGAPTAARVVLAGTPGYMSPEQMLGREVDERTDIFSLGVILYEMTTGRRPYTGTDPLDLIVRVAKQPPRADVDDPRVPPMLADIIARALEIDAADRFQTATELESSLEHVHAGADLVPEPPHDTEGTRRDAGQGAARRRRWQWVAGVTVSAAVILAAIAIGRWREPTAFPERGRVLIADPDNQTEDGDLARTIGTGLSIELRQSPYVNVLTRAQVFDALGRMKRSDIKVLDEATAMELAQREGIPLVVTSRVNRRSGTLWIAARGVVPTTREELFAENAHYDRPEDSFTQIDTLARNVRRDLGESWSAIDKTSKPLARVTTGSFPALTLYSKAADEYARGNPDAAPPLLERALGLDPRFAMAHRLMARVYEMRGNPGKDREHLEEAYQLRDSLSERERHEVEAAYFSGRGEYEKAAATLTALTSLYPDDGDARYELAVAYRNAGNLRRSGEEFEAALALNPSATEAYASLVLVLTRLSDYSRAAEVSHRAEQRNIRSPRLTWALGMVMLGQGRTSDARREFERVEETGDVYASTARLYLASTDIYDGKLATAAAELEAGILLDQKSHDPLPERKRRYFLARIDLLRGDPAGARAQLDAILSAGIEKLEAQELTFTGMLLARTGDVPRAKQVLQQLERLRNERGSGHVRSCYENVLGEIALREGNDKQSEKSFLAAAEYPQADSTYGLARVYTARRDWARAQAQWDKIIRAPGEILMDGFSADWVLAHLEAGRVSRDAGDQLVARKYYAAFLNIWAKGDDLAIRRQAGVEWAALGAP